MRAFADRPIRQKVAILVALASLAGVALAAIAVATYETAAFRPRVVRDLSTLGAFLQINTVPALEFDDPTAAQENLATLRSRPEISSAAIYRADGRLFTSYHRDGGQPLIATTPHDSSLVFTDGQLVLTAPVVSDRERLGWLRLQYQLPTLWERLPQYAVMVLVVLLAVITTATLLLAALGRSLATPLGALADTARRLTDTRDLNLRASKHADDEIGALTTTFNRMLDTLQERDIALRESETRLRLALDASSLAMWVLPRGGPADGAALEGLLADIHPADAEVVRRAILKAAEAPAAIETEFRRSYSSGEERQFMLRGQSYSVEEGGPPQLIGVIGDITDRRRVERQLIEAQKMEAIGNLAGGIAHDFNNLLTGMIGYLKFAQQQLAPGTQVRQDIDEVERAALRAASLTSQLLSYARRQMVMPRLVNLNESVRALEPLLRRLLGENITIEVGLQPDIRSTRVDPGQLEQVLVNLAVNARDAMPAGGRLTITTREVALDASDAAARELQPGSYVELAVADTGTGIAPDIVERIFEPFFTTKPPGEGTGLGLAMCYGIAKQADGSVVVDTVLGEGATFRVLLPVAEEPAPAEGRALPEPGAPGSETILLVEDDAIVRELAGRTLRGAGYDVLEADSADAAEAVASTHLHRIDLVVSDVVMPGASGWELAESLRARRTSLPVLFISGYTGDVVRRGRGRGDDIPMLTKPFTPDQLLVAARRIIDVARPASP